MTPDEKERLAHDPAGGVVVPLRPGLAVLAVVFLALAMISTTPTGFVCGYTPLALTEALTAGLLALAACTLAPRAWSFPPVLGRAVIVTACLVLAARAGYRLLEPADEPPASAHAIFLLAALTLAAWVARAAPTPASFAAGALAALALFLSGEAVFASGVNQPFDTAYAAAVIAAAAAGFALTASLLVHLGDPAVRRRRLFAAQMVLLFVAGAVLRVAGALGSPDPGIDVYHAEQEAADHLLAGRNPYTQDYDDKGAPFYPPLPFLLAAPFRAAGWDVRLANAVCDLLAALALFAAARAGGNRLLAGLLAAAYLHFPRIPLIMELAWYEPMLAAALGCGLLLVARGWRLGYVLLGLGITGKQYVVVVLPPLWKAWRGRRLALFLATAATAAVVVLPFYLWDSSAFFERVVKYHLNHEVRHDGVTLQAAAMNRFHTELPKWLLSASALGLLGVITWRTPSHGPSPAPWMATALLVFCLFFSQAFLNYFYLCQYLLLLGLGDWFRSDTALHAGTNDAGLAQPL
jgi:hypothetical protein